jgi:hypothetical protein
MTVSSSWATTASGTGWPVTETHVATRVARSVVVRDSTSVSSAMRVGSAVTTLSQRFVPAFRTRIGSWAWAPAATPRLGWTPYAAARAGLTRTRTGVTRAWVAAS